MRSDTRGAIGEPQALRRWAERRERRSRSILAALLIRPYRLRPFRPLIRGALEILEGGRIFSRTLREILRRHYRVEVGMYSYGGCLEPGRLPPGSRVGNYCSIASDLHVYRRNHPARLISQHPFFYNRTIGLVVEDSIEKIHDNPLVVGHDVWIGRHTIILPGCKVIGDGAIVGAGSVVTRDVESYVIVAGNPARPIGLRFDPRIEERVRASRWWLRPLPELVQCLDAFLVPASSEALDRLVETLQPGKAAPPVRMEEQQTAGAKR
ncbi:MAG: CatB-related O-acetyltransferase [Planctomycetota bacterium]